VQQSALTDATLRGWALGEPDFVADLQKRTGRRLSKAQAGRPLSKKIFKKCGLKPRGYCLFCSLFLMCP